MYKKWIRDIRRNTISMKASERAEYIAEYYWYHILLTFLGLGILVLFMYHISLGRQATSYKCVLVNTTADTVQTDEIRQQLSNGLLLSEDRIIVDPAYHVSYTGHERTAGYQQIDYSGYDKFFFAWANHELDMVIMPTSLYSYCVELGGTFLSINDAGDTYIELELTVFSGLLKSEETDPLVIVFPSDGKHTEKSALLLTGGIMVQEDMDEG